MMNRFMLITTIFFLILLGTASAEQGGYFSVGAGGAFITDSTATDSVGDTAELSFDPGFLLEANMGYDFGAARLEGELSYLEAEIDTIEIPGFPATGVDSDVSSLNFMANVYGELENQTTVTPYIIAGLGFSRVEVSNGSISGIPVWTEDDETVFAYQLGAGVGFEISESIVLDLKYRYFATEDVEFELLKVENSSHNISADLRYYF